MIHFSWSRKLLPYRGERLGVALSGALSYWFGGSWRWVLAFQRPSSESYREIVDNVSNRKWKCVEIMVKNICRILVELDGRKIVDNGRNRSWK